MKARLSFVTNSSSSSFVVIDASNGFVDVNKFTKILKAGKKGETCFGWGAGSCIWI